MHFSSRILFAITSLWLYPPLLAVAEQQQPASADVEFFENRIRPVLVEHCYECHSAGAKNLKGGLRLDSREAMLKGGDTGPAVIAGNPNASLLIRALRREDKNLKIPEGDRAPLTPAQIEDFVTWIGRGAAYPRSGKTVKLPQAAPDALAQSRRFWSFQPIAQPSSPRVKRTDWCRNYIDTFVLGRLEEKGLSPSPPADRRTLLRRATYDLTGLPPTPGEINAFVADASPQSFGKVVDRLLASPHYGEQWGRHWLDVARYADTRWVGAAEERRFPFAYTYRDWVIGALNRDMPYDRFVTLQLAADQVPGGAEKSDLAALGFLTVGRWFTGIVHDVIDDQIDVVTRGFLGMSAQCTRCHDHKFDPIFTDDYYSLYGVFAASRMPVEATGMLAELPEVDPSVIDAATENDIATARKQIDQFLLDHQARVRDEFGTPKKMAEYLLAAESAIAIPDKQVKEFIKSRELNETIINRWLRIMKRTVKEPHPVWSPWHALAALSEQDFAAKAPAVLEQEKAKRPNKNVLAILSPAPASLGEFADRYVRLLIKFDQAEQVPDREEEAIRQIVRGNESPTRIPVGELAPFFSKEEFAQIVAWRRAALAKLARMSSGDDAALAFRKEVAPLVEDVRVFLKSRADAMSGEFGAPEKIAEYLLAAQEGRSADELRMKSIANGKKLSERMLQRWVAFLKRGADENEPVFAIWRAFCGMSEKDFTARAPALLAELKKSPRNRLVAEAFDVPPASLRDVAIRYGAVIAKFDKPEPTADADSEAIRQISAGPQSLTHLARDEVADFITQKEKDELKNKETKLLRLYVDHPGTGGRAMVLHETPRSYAQRVFVRGNPTSLGRDTSGKFLAVLRDEQSRPFSHGKGRYELAQAITNPSNPLTARVMVNRVWLEHFGAGLVRTPSDFGTRGDAPSHPELLDSLAQRFMAGGWSLKKLHRDIMLSATYQQSSDDNPAARQVDAENRLLWRMNRRRLSFEQIRDSLLIVAGRLDDAIGGKAEDLLKAGSYRRTVYGLIDRTIVPGVYRYFDFPSADAHIAERHETIIPQQALFMMNNGMVMDQAWHLAHRPELATLSDPQRRIAMMYRLAYGREPNSQEMSLGIQFIASAPQKDAAKLDDAWRYGFGRFDEKAGRVRVFELLPYFGNNTWKGGAQENDPQLGRCSLNARGGFVGNERSRSAIRRWIAPCDGTFSIMGTLSSQPNSLVPTGEGVRGRIVSSRGGQLGVWIAQGTEEPTNVDSIEIRGGDAIDFIAEFRGGQEAFGNFMWAPVIRVKNAGADASKGMKLVWDAAKDFGGATNAKQYGIWERYAQVLLESNEFLFLD